jgi:hypothetical protein
MMLYEDADSTLLRLLECFLEAAPQLVLQLYIMASQGTGTETFRSKYETAQNLGLVWNKINFVRTTPKIMDFY